MITPIRLKSLARNLATPNDCNLFALKSHDLLNNFFVFAPRFDLGNEKKTVDKESVVHTMQSTLL